MVRLNRLLTLFLFLLIPFALFAQVNPNYHYVEGYYRSNGTYVKGHYKTNPNHTNRDNYSTKPNVNPWNGKRGWITPDNKVNPYNSSPQNNYYNGNLISSHESSTYNSTFNRLYSKEINYYDIYDYKSRLIIEEFLSNLELDTGRVDGNIDYKTVWAVRDLQELIGVSPDGMFGPKTILKIEKISNSK